jgi:ABC-type phosphate transport system substrate-binding protein
MRPPLVALLLTLLLALPAHGEIVVIAHPDCPLSGLTAKDISDLYLGRSRPFIDGEPVLILDQPRDSTLRRRFFSLVNGMDLRRVNAYWARLQFSGDTQPPLQVADSQSVIDVVKNNRNAIGYIDASAVTAAVRTVLQLKEQ